MKKHVFIDTEYSSQEAPKLLSIGLVSEDGSELYVELAATGLPAKLCTFVRDTVLPQWGLAGTPVDSLGVAGVLIGTWLSRISTEGLFICYDYHTDMDLLEEVLKAGGCWQRTKALLVPTHVGYLLGDPVVKAGMESSWKTSFEIEGLSRHHGLADARALMAGFRSMHGAF